MLEIQNNLTRKEEIFHPLENKTVKMYTCGPSTYQRPHIGNYRTFLFEDIFQRYLEYLGYKVTRLITLTDVEDKAIAQAEKEGSSVDELTNRNETIFFKDFEQLHIKRPEYTVRASTIADQAVRLIKDLLEKGVAYKCRHDGRENIYFDPQEFPSFGKLAHLDMKQWPKRKRRFHLDTYPGMPWNKGDFVLWHGCKVNERVCWNTGIGNGRPAWNIQDAAMVTKHLGFTIDVACGGIDNLVRHHDYTIAVAEAVSGLPLAKYWLHGGHLFVDGKKMSKSKGNVLYPSDVTARGYSNEHVRFFLIYGAYGVKRNFTWQEMSNVSRRLDKIGSMVRNLREANSSNSNSLAKAIANNITKHFERYMNSDLDVKSSFDAVYACAAKLDELRKNGKLAGEDADTALNNLRKIDRVLQIIF